MPYWSNIESADTIVARSHTACATRSRSNGSLWAAGSERTAHACLVRDWQRFERELLEAVEKVVGNAELAEATLDRRFPDTHCAEQHRLAWILDRRSRVCDALVPGEHPQQGVGVEQQRQLKCSRNSAGSSSKSSASSISPRSVPNASATGRRCSMATSLATGRPERWITTSSPPSASSTSFDSWLFASCMPTLTTQRTVPDLARSD